MYNPQEIESIIVCRIQDIHRTHSDNIIGELYFMKQLNKCRNKYEKYEVLEATKSEVVEWMLENNAPRSIMLMFNLVVRGGKVLAYD